MTAKGTSATLAGMPPIPELRNVEERSFWQATMPALPDRSGRDLPDAADVVVVGGGLTGLSAARRAAELGASVVLLEAERIGWGASTRNGGFCHPGFKQSLTALRRLHGPERAATLYRETIDAFEHVERLCSTADRRRLRPDRPPGPRLRAVARGGLPGCRRGDAGRGHGGPRRPARRTCASEIGSDAYAGGLVVERSAGLHPGKLVAGLASLAEAAGAALHEETAALRDATPGRRPHGGRDVARRADRARGHRRDERLHRRAHARRCAAGSWRSAATSSSPSRCPADLAARDQPPSADCSSTRRTSSSTGGSRPTTGCCSAAGRACGRRRSPRRPGSCSAAMVEIHPQLWQTPVAYAWGGRVAFTYDRMVHAGRADGVTYAMGCCGSGVAIMPWLGMRVAEWVGGGAPPEIASLSFPLVPGAVRGAGLVPAARGRVLEGEGPAGGAGGGEGGAERRLAAAVARRHAQARRRRVASRRSMSASVVR